MSLLLTLRKARSAARLQLSKSRSQCSCTQRFSRALFKSHSLRLISEGVLSKFLKKQCVFYSRLMIFLLIGTYTSYAAEFVRQYTFATPASQVKWENNGNRHVCRIYQQVQDYGQAVFVTRAGRPTYFEVESWQGLSKGVSGEVWIVPPTWRHDLVKKRLAHVALHAGNYILFLDKEKTQHALFALSSGAYLRLLYDVEMLGREHMTVDVSSVGWQSAFEQYNHCLDRLLPYDFDAISSMSLYFESNSEDLSLKTRLQLNKIIRYLEAGADITHIVLKGYTDTEGGYEHNRRLAGRRAHAVKDYLANHGIPPEIITIEDVFGRYRLTQKGYKGRRVHLQLMH